MPRPGSNMNLDSFIAQAPSHLPDLLTALAIGLLIGLERERNPTAKGGLRTFALVGLSGAATAMLAQVFSAPSIIAAGLVAIALMMIAAYYHHHEAFHEWEPGTTTIVAVMVCYLLGALVVAGHRQSAVILAILVTTLLYFKAELRGAARGLERRDLVSILQFAIVTFVVLPLLPDRGYGPAGALNPRHIWLMVVLISGVSLAGYVALRIVGPARGALLMGLLGGLVSSTATTLSFSRHAKAGTLPTDLCAAVIIAANLVLPLRLAVLTAAVSPGALPVVGPVLGAAFLTGTAVYLPYWRRRTRDQSALSVPAVNNPSELRSALGFAVLYAAVLLLTAWVVELAGNYGLYAVAAVSGLTDVDAITLSTLRLHGTGTLSAGQVSVAIVIAVTANTSVKLAITAFAGSGVLFRQCLPVMLAVVAGAVSALVIFG